MVMCEVGVRVRVKWKEGWGGLGLAGRLDLERVDAAALACCRETYESITEAW